MDFGDHDLSQSAGRFIEAFVGGVTVLFGVWLAVAGVPELSRWRAGDTIPATHPVLASCLIAASPLLVVMGLRLFRRSSLTDRLLPQLALLLTSLACLLGAVWVTSLIVFEDSPLDLLGSVLAFGMAGILGLSLWLRRRRDGA